MNDVVAAIIGVLGLAVTILMGLVKFLYGRIKDVEASQIAINSELRQEMQIQASGHRDAQRDLWTELRSMAKTDNEQHAHMLERISTLATREELKSDLASMESRISTMLRKEVTHR